jgi:hypothetical protein
MQSGDRERTWRQEWLSRGRVFAILIAMASAVILDCDCDGPRSLRNVVVLVDETLSFDMRSETGERSHLWPDALEKTATIVQRLDEGDRFWMIRIDSSGGEDEDVPSFPTSQLPFTVPHEITRFAKQRTLAREILDLQQRPNPAPGTDIFGALEYAAELASRSAPGEPKRECVVLIFSDMVPDRNDPEFKTTTRRFPEGTRLYCLDVVAKGMAMWDARVERWIAQFRRFGVEVKPSDFFNVRESADAVNSLFPPR